MDPRVRAHTLGGPWDLVAAYNWDYNMTLLIIGVTPISPLKGIVRRVERSVIGGY